MRRAEVPFRPVLAWLGRCLPLFLMVAASLVVVNAWGAAGNDSPQPSGETTPLVETAEPASESDSENPNEDASPSPNRDAPIVNSDELNSQDDARAIAAEQAKRAVKRTAARRKLFSKKKQNSSESSTGGKAKSSAKKDSANKVPAGKESPNKDSAGKSNSDEDKGAGTKTAKSKAPAKGKQPDQSEKKSGDPGEQEAGDATDPVKQNGPIFKDWEKPKFTFVFTGDQLGYIEPCGCAGLENQKGGLARRLTFIRQLQQRDWNPVPMDVGGLVKSFGSQAQLKYELTHRGLLKMGYKAVGYGADDLRLDPGFLFGLLSDEAQTSPFVSANVAILVPEGEPNQLFRVFEQSGIKIGVTSVLSEASQSAINNDQIFLTKIDAVLPDVAKKIAKQADLGVLLFFGELNDARKVAQKYPQFKLVVAATGIDEPPIEAEPVGEAGQLLIEVGHKGMFAVALGYHGGKEPFQYQRVPLDSRFEAAPEMIEELGLYQEQLKAYGWAALGVNPSDHPQRAKKGDFLGSKSCEECHKKAYATWLETSHAHATQTLIDLVPHRQFDPECISCHSTGWEPQQYFPFSTGFDGEESTPLLMGNGCENCHGPGAAHVKAEKSGSKGAQKELRAALRISKDAAKKQVCMRCHDVDNSPDFDKPNKSFDDYFWPLVEHPGKD